MNTEPTTQSAESVKIALLGAEVAHWKAHAEEAGRGFARVCQDYARVSARNVALTEGVEAWALSHFGYMPPELGALISPVEGSDGGVA